MRSGCSGGAEKAAAAAAGAGAVSPRTQVHCNRQSRIEFRTNTRIHTHTCPLSVCVGERGREVTMDWLENRT